MTVSLDLLEAMRRAGLEAVQQLKVIEGLLQLRAERRRARRAAVATMTPESRPVPVEQDSAGMVEAPVATPQRAGHVHNGGHKTVARAALLALPGLRPAARLVGAQLVEFADVATGLCWPSIGRIADNTGLSRRSVSRALGELRAAGLLGVALHGGQHHTNAYKLLWPALRAAAAPPAAKLNDQDSGATMTLVSADHDRGVTEILSPNPEQTELRALARRRRRRRDAAADGQRHLPLMAVLPGGQGSTAFGEAGQRVWTDISLHTDVAIRRQLLDLVDRQPGLQERATFAEMRRQGSGIGVLLLAAEQAPAAAAG